MSRITGVVVALATAAAVLTGSTADAGTGAAAPPTAQLPREITGGVELTLADGDQLRVWAATNYRTVWAKRYDAATGAWGARTVVLREKNLSRGSVDARTANGAVAVTARCDRFGYAEDQAPTHSRAVWSADTVTWSSYRLEGEAYEEPGISPDGSRAVWPESDRYVTFGPDGFTRHALETPGQEYTATTTITDTGQVSYLYGKGLGGRCGLVALTRTGDDPPTRQVLRFDSACSDSNFANLDANTALFGDFSNPAFVTTIARADASSPWAVTAIAPASAPGLERAGGRRLPTDFFDPTGFPLLALGAGKGQPIRAQAYDTATQTWGPSTVAYDPGGKSCRWGDNWIAQPLAVVAVTVRCGVRSVVLTTSDAVHWQALRMARHVPGISPDGTYVAVPGRSSTSIISPERGVVALPLGVGGACDVVVPDGPDGAVLLTASGRHHGWPTVLQHSSPTGWDRISRTNLPTYAQTCVKARSSNYELPYRFDIYSTWKGYSVRVVQRGGVWKALRSRY
ncbi:hypothetical protein J2X46_000099 [Nocardioides sp. BE266]|uniref:hypothetical protein n=1 Tax=Nocardioides sp. BE266 TaxID=2817725 RepID=UPI002860CE78|nr:hypothetical protein [Nocardioides sp. BE266]MDR7251127.1 hypothetical protein [Nocardioides sp. BE266]